MDQITLYTFAVSQASEKIRWALDWTGTPYIERRLTPFVHASRFNSNSGALFASMPVLEADNQILADSTQILEWLGKHRAPFALFPRDPAVRAAAMAIESRFDQAAVHLLRWVYLGLLGQRELASKLWSLDANPLQALALRVGFPVIQRVFKSGLGFEPSKMKHAKQMIDLAVMELNRATESGRRYLAGPTLSVADITAAALLAPLACPDEHPVYSRRDYRKGMEAVLRPWAGQPGIEWVRSLYKCHRHASVADPIALPWTGFTDRQPTSRLGRLNTRFMQ